MFKALKRTSIEKGDKSVFEKILSFDKRGIFKNIAWISFDRLFRLLLSLFVGAAVARYLGPTGWGKINYVLAFVNIASAVVTMGLDGFLIKELLEDPERKNKFLGTAFRIRCYGIILTFIITLAVYQYLNLSIEYYVIFFFLFLHVLIIPFDLIDIDFQSKLQSKNSVQAKGVAYIVGAFIKVLAILLNMPVEVFAAILGLEALLACVLLINKYRKKQGNLKQWSYDKALIKRFVEKGWPFLLSALSVIIYMRLDQIMLGNILSVQKVGEFTAAVRITEIFLFIPMAVTGSYYATLLQAKESSDDQYRLKVQFLFSIMFLISLAIAIGITLFSNVIIQILYGQQFVEAATILRIHVWSLIAVFLGVASNQYLVVENLQKITFYSTLMGLVSNIVLNIFFIPKWGGIGAAYATIISYFIAAIISNVFFKKSRIVFVYQLQSFLALLRPKSLYKHFN